MVLRRIKEYIDSKHISISAFEKSIGMSNASFGKSLKNNGAIGSDKLEVILKVYKELNPIWLLTGEGEMLRQNNSEAANSQKVEPTIIYRSDPKDLEIIQLLRDKVKLLEQNASQPPPQLGFYAPQPPLEKPAAVNPIPITPEPKQPPKSEINR